MKRNTILTAAAIITAILSSSCVSPEERERKDNQEKVITDVTDFNWRKSSDNIRFAGNIQETGLYIAEVDGEEYIIAEATRAVSIIPKIKK